MTSTNSVRASSGATWSRHRLRPVGALLAVVAVTFAACDDDVETIAPPDTATRQTLSNVTGEPFPAAELTIRHQAPQADVDVTYTVTCSAGDAAIGGGDVDVDPQAACAALGDPAVVDRLVEGPPDDQVCTEQFGGEDVATIDGTIETAPVGTTVDRVNGCGISTWDELLAPILPTAVGVVE